MPGNPERKLAAHVQAAIAAGQGKIGGQAKLGGNEGGRQMAAHVQAAIAAGQGKTAGQAKLEGTAGGRQMAAHVRAAVGARRGPGKSMAAGVQAATVGTSVQASKAVYNPVLAASKELNISPEDVKLELCLLWNRYQEKFSLRCRVSGCLGNGLVTVYGWYGEGDFGHVTMQFDFGKTILVDVQGDYRKSGILKEFGMAEAGELELPYRSPVFKKHETPEDMIGELVERKPSRKQKARVVRYDGVLVVKARVAASILVPLLQKYSIWRLKGASVYSALKEAKGQYEKRVEQAPSYPPSIPVNVEVIRCMSILELLIVALDERLSVADLPTDIRDLVEGFAWVLVSGKKGLAGTLLQARDRKVSFGRPPLLPRPKLE